MKTGLAIVSGGMDSITMLYEFQQDIAHVLSFHYGSKHNDKELPFAKFHAEKLQIPHTQISLSFIADYFQSALLQTGGAIPDGHYADDIMKQTVVPFRNGIMLSIAAGFAESHNLTTLYLANHFGDHAIYPDCRQLFIEPMSQAIQEGTYIRVHVISPYINCNKREIALHGQSLGVDYSQTWSCYKGQAFHCGTCGTCVERKEALAGFDPTRYVHD
jgi:7-cyano-7-deazaguanine synthase